ncbi:MAG: hypothetical protein WD273_08595 [Trueperaceae bacterium]
MRGVFITGENDGAREMVESTYRLLDEAGLDVQLRVIPGRGHVYPPGFADLLREALDFVLEAGHGLG